jgi:hypothetical protein
MPPYPQKGSRNLSWWDGLVIFRGYEAERIEVAENRIAPQASFEVMPEEVPHQIVGLGWSASPQ